MSDISILLSQYLTFSVAEEKYAISVSKVREVLDMVPITKVPQMPAFMKGVLNLRGSVVPVIDIRLKFGMKAQEYGVTTSIIIMEIHKGDKVVLMGGLVDSVQEVIDLAETKIEPAPHVGTSVRSEFIAGMCEYGDRFLIILDIDKVLNSDEISSVESAGNIEKIEETVEEVEDDDE